MRLILVAIALVLSGCATAQRYDAAGDVHALLVAIRDNDRPAFEAHVDRPGLKRQIEGRIVREAGPLGALLAGPVANFAGDALVQPQVFRAVASYYGYTPDKPLPDRLAIGAALRPTGDGRVCAPRKKDGPCLLIFENQGGVWRLSSFEGEISDLRP